MRFVPISLLAILASGCTTTFTGREGTIKYHTLATLWSPNATVVEFPDGTMHVLGGSSTIGQLAGPAAVAYAGHEVGEGLKDSGDTINVGEEGLLGDLNGDGMVDVTDLGLLVGSWSP